MSRFKRIKNTSTKKSSVSIDEKIAALNKELEKRIEILEKEIQHLKAVLQYQMRKKKK